MTASHVRSVTIRVPVLILRFLQRLELLAGTCRGRPVGGAYGSTGCRLRKMLRGVHPRTGEDLGEPRPIDPATTMFDIVLGPACLAQVGGLLADPGFGPGFRVGGGLGVRCCTKHRK